MIDVLVERGERGYICLLKVRNHGESIVCAAVSALVLNSVNSIDAFTDEGFTCEYEEEGGYLKIAFPHAEIDELGHDAALLINSLMLGLRAIAAEYPSDITISDTI
ncbi:MAG: ribosomal-processing cysteine protease Prp [Defluviitaleaceae bacterium]|nr:ribosomal-processing cysteine protease Prp [Defluviitaleaceae bacterium]